MSTMASPITNTTLFIQAQIKKKHIKLRVTGLCAGNSQNASNEENVSIWWRHRVWENTHMYMYMRDISELKG